MKHISELKINKPIAIMCVGPSLLEISEDDRKYIKDNCYTIAVNYAPIFKPDAIYFSDVNIDYLKSEKRADIYITREKNAENYPDMIDYFFDLREDKDLAYNYSLYIILYLVTLYHHSNKILLFGVDMNKDTPRKLDLDDEGNHIESGSESYTDHLDKINRDLAEDFKRRREYYVNVYNCNPDSKLDLFPKMYVRDII